MKSTFPEWIFDGSPIPDPTGRAARVLAWFDRLKHLKSKHPGKALRLDPWQRRMIERIYGPTDAAGNRQVYMPVLVIPRGNRKTTFSAQLALNHTIGPERVPGGEAILAAVNREQANIAFREALNVIRADPRIERELKIYEAHNGAKKIVYPKDGCTLEIIPSDGAGIHGRTPNFVLADELHVWPNGDLWEALTGGSDKIDDALFIVATTAGRGQTNTAWDVVESARKVAGGEVDDPGILPILFESPRDVDWRSEDAWRRVNPGASCTPPYPSLAGYQRHALRAERSASELARLLQYKFSVWLDAQTDPFVDMAVYDEGAAAIDVEALRGRPCWIGVDLSKTTDLTAVVAALRDGAGGFVVIPHFFVPGEAIAARSERDKVPYDRWAKEGLLTAIPGAEIDNRVVAGCVRDLCERFDVKEIAFDPAWARDIIRDLEDEGLPVIRAALDPKSQTNALRTLEGAIVGKRFRHGGHAVLRWNFDNVAIKTGSTGLRTMVKSLSRERIDGAFATMLAVDRAAYGEDHGSIYSDTSARPTGLQIW